MFNRIRKSKVAKGLASIITPLVLASGIYFSTPKFSYSEDNIASRNAMVQETYSVLPKTEDDKSLTSIIEDEKSNIIINKAYITSSVNGQISSIKNKEVKVEDTVKLNLVVEASVDGKKLYFSDVNDVTLNGKKLDSKIIKPWVHEDIDITWYKVEAEKSSYNNWETGKFVMEVPKYKETKILEGEEWSIIADANPTDILKDVNDGLGTMRYKVEVFHNNKTISTPGKNSVGAYGINNDVHRISFRTDDSFTGWMTSFFNIPYIFGNRVYQVENYIGVDCADLVIAAYRRVGHDIPYTHVTGLYQYSKVIANEKNVKLEGKEFYHKGKPLLFGKDVKEGDLLVFENSHVGVLYKDKSDPKGEFKGEADGTLNEYDTIIHVYYDNPKEEALDFVTRFSVVEFGKFYPSA